MTTVCRSGEENNRDCGEVRLCFPQIFFKSLLWPEVTTQLFKLISRIWILGVSLPTVLSNFSKPQFSHQLPHLWSALLVVRIQWLTHIKLSGQVNKWYKSCCPQGASTPAPYCTSFSLLFLQADLSEIPALQYLKIFAKTQVKVTPLMGGGLEKASAISRKIQIHC